MTTGTPGSTGLRLVRGPYLRVEADALAERVGARVGVGTVLDDLDRRLGRARSRGLGRGVHRAWAFDRDDRRDPRWWPQGVTTGVDAADADPGGRVAGRRVLATTWYAKTLPGDEGSQGVRVTLVDVEARRYRHVLVVVPTTDAAGRPWFRPLRVHAGGLVWAGAHLYVAATARGFLACRADDLLRVPDDAPDLLAAAFGYRYLLPVRTRYRAAAEEGTEPLRYSFLSLDRTGDPPHPPQLLVGEYGRQRQTRRLVRFALDPGTLLPVTDADGLARPEPLPDGVAQMQGAVMVGGRLYLTSSRGPRGPGSVFAGQPGALREHRRVTPPGVEDLAYEQPGDLLWSVTEHPGRRWLFCMRRPRFDD